MTSGRTPTRMLPPLLAAVVSAALACGPIAGPARLRLPDTPPDIISPVSASSVRFAVLGDSGTGGQAQYDVAAQLTAAHDVFPFEFVIMLGDNMYGPERPRDFQRKFEQPYKVLLDKGVSFHASLGNHDNPNQRFYGPFNMGGERFYTFTRGTTDTPAVRFFALDSTYMSGEQIEWLERELRASDAPWNIAFFHHPLYSSGGRHGSELDLRVQLEPLFVEHGVNVVFAGHDHLYERVKPQHGVHHFVAGASAKLRAGDIRPSDLTAAGYDRDHSFMLVEIAGNDLHFQAITRRGHRVDADTIPRTPSAGVSQE
jgi:hypothetical protein